MKQLDLICKYYWLKCYNPALPKFLGNVHSATEFKNKIHLASYLVLSGNFNHNFKQYISETNFYINCKIITKKKLYKTNQNLNAKYFIWFA